jgi:hypothetical protein
MIQTIAGAIGGIVILLGLIGFARLIWSRPPNRERHGGLPSTLPPGALGAIRDPLGHTDPSGHDGGNR